MNKFYEEIMISQNRYCEDIDLDIICVYVCGGNVFAQSVPRRRKLGC